MPKEKQRIHNILSALKRSYPDVTTQLMHDNPFQLLVATILSAQCTDKQVNAVTPKLFEILKCPKDFLDVPLTTLENLIHSTGFFRSKANNIQKCCKILIENFDGQVPNTLEKLITLPGVGRKTANVVLSTVFGVPSIVVDTHVARIAGRLGFTNNTDPYKIECDLMRIIPKNEWNDLSLRLIYFGREYCRARQPLCNNCPISSLCEFYNKLANT